MSTKIYDGFCFKKKMSLNEVHDIFMDFRKEAEEIKKCKLNEYFSKAAYKILDGKAIGRKYPEMKDRSILSYLWCDFCNRIREMEKTRQRDPEIDFNCEISIQPLKNKILGIIYGECIKIKEAWFNKEFIKEYGYWNNTDKPEGITDKQWERRCVDWDKALGERGIPAYTGLSAKITDNSYVLDFDNLKFPSYKDRLEEAAKSLIWSKKLKSEMSLSIGDLINFDEEMSKYFKSREGREKISAIKNEIKLVKRIKKKDLE